jgi:hypothetical protein
LAAARARGVKLGGRRANTRPPDPAIGHAAQTAASDAFAVRPGPLLADMRERGLSLRQMVAELTAQGVQTRRGGRWSACAVRNVLLRLAGQRSRPSRTPPSPTPASAVPWNAYRPPGTLRE